MSVLKHQGGGRVSEKHCSPFVGVYVGGLRVGVCEPTDLVMYSGVRLQVCDIQALHRVQVVLSPQSPLETPEDRESNFYVPLSSKNEKNWDIQYI